MTEEEIAWYVETVAAATMANKAVMTLSMAGIPISRQNATQAYGKWINPDSAHFERLVTAVDKHVAEMLATADVLSEPAQGSA
ncbi:hypothetical protein [Agrobacterium larrymoorei]|uniref:hypothetical protein n=1 Tax=Agrobacterium larrymoorei TaxID=160699 RepID=UPI0027D81272|nr:hypothetical protein [Agrobacterium larrymoorei]